MRRLKYLNASVDDTIMKDEHMKNEMTAKPVPTFESLALVSERIETKWTLDDLRKPGLGRKDYPSKTDVNESEETI